LITLGDSYFKDGKTDFDYIFGRLTNVFIPEGEDRKRVAFFWGMIRYLHNVSKEEQEQIKLMAMKWCYEGNRSFQKIHGFIELYLSNPGEFYYWSSFFEDALACWYERINFSVKTAVDLNYWEVGKERHSISN
jgi:hypothetical protein